MNLAKSHSQESICLSDIKRQTLCCSQTRAIINYLHRIMKLSTGCRTGREGVTRIFLPPFIRQVTCSSFAKFWLLLSHQLIGSCSMAPPLKSHNLQGGTYPESPNWNSQLQALKPSSHSQRTPYSQQGKPMVLTNSTSLPALHSL